MPAPRCGKCVFVLQSEDTLAIATAHTAVSFHQAASPAGSNTRPGLESKIQQSDMNAHHPLFRFWTNIGLALLLAAVATTQIHAQNLVSNGGFESPQYSSPPFYRYLANASWQPQLGTLPGWTVLDDGVGEPPYLAALPAYTNVVHHGSYGIALNQGSGIRTTVAIESNATYRLAFWLTLQGNSTPSPLQITVAGIVTNVPVSNSWAHHTLEFTAASTDPASLIQFNNISPVGPGKTIGLDEISLVKYPTLQVRLLPTLILEGQLGRTYRVEYVDALSDTNLWVTLTNLVLPTSPFIVFDPQAVAGQRRFYRATTP